MNKVEEELLDYEEQNELSAKALETKEILKLNGRVNLIYYHSQTNRILNILNPLY